MVNFLKRSGEPDYNYSVTEREKSGIVFDGSDEDEELLNEAVPYLIRSGKASTSMLQRRLRIGYSRAARLMDALEDQGIIGAQDGARPREVLIDEWPPAESLDRRREIEDLEPRREEEPTEQKTLEESDKDVLEEDEQTEDKNEEEDIDMRYL